MFPLIAKPWLAKNGQNRKAEWQLPWRRGHQISRFLGRDPGNLIVTFQPVHQASLD
jgi:hypothetical protein